MLPKQLVFCPFLRHFIEYFVNIFLCLLELNLTQRHGVYGVFLNDTEAPSVQGATEKTTHKTCINVIYKLPLNSKLGNHNYEF